ncbi:MAG: hypothetical protein PHR77_09845 [Kiritimatiellae bacterium]|nr:hypothetical protein [Kiritimatiellia bacterium]MDD5522599.1 hypothetical protein [Kiritimatiellia bacterium]
MQLNKLKHATGIFVFAVVWHILTSLTFAAGNNIALKCKTFCYEISPTGKNIAFTDLSQKKDYLKVVEGDKAYCASVTKGTKTFVPTSVSFENNVLSLKFAEADVTASVKVTNKKTRLIFEVVDVTGSPDSFTFVNIPLTLDAIPAEPFAACSLSLNLHTHVYELPALHRELWASCYQRFGFKNARAAVIGVPQKKILPVIRDVMKKAVPDVPFCDQGGAWALGAKEGYGSYLMNFGSLTEETVDQWIKNCNEFGFNQIDNHGSGNFFLFGSFELDKKKFPEGWQTYKKIVDKLHKAGISSIFHTYTCYISQNSKYVTPVPHPDLDILTRFTLDAPLDEKAAEIAVKESTKDVSTRIGYMETSSRTIRIGDEIIQFTDVTREAPYKFTGCKRGFHGTKIVAHQAGVQVGLLKTFWNGMYIPEPHSPLFDEVARRTAEIVNECGFDGVYLDAIEGLQYMWGKENYWYYGDKFVFELMKNLKKPVGLEYAGMIHHWWHFRSRYQAWDMVTRGYKRFMDVRIASMKAGEEYQHGSWGGYWPEIEKYGPMKDCGLYLPLQFGWWGFRAWQSPKQDAMFLDDIEYVCCKMIGNNAGLSMTGVTDEKTQEAHPVYRDFIKMIHQYEELRHQNYFSEEVCARLRVPGKEFTLFRADNGKWNFKPVFYKQHKVAGLDHPSAQWQLDNEFATQPVKLRLETLMSSAAYDNPQQTDVLDHTTVAQFKKVRTAPGVDCELKKSDAKVPATSEAVVELVASSTGESVQKASWGCLTKVCEPALNLGNKTALGVWIKGDGNGELVDLKLCSGGAGMALHQSSHYVKVDFTGWKYFTFIEPESTRITDYKWPVLAKYYVYDNHIGVVNYAGVTEVQIWVNNLPANKKVSCLIGPVKAIPMAPVKIENPSVAINGQKITFPVTMETGMFLELKSAQDCKLYSPAGKVIQEVVPTGNVPVLKDGANELSFSAQTADKVSTRMQVTVSAEGKPL